MPSLPDIHISSNQSELALIVRDATIEDLEPFWPLHDQTTRYLTEGDQATLATPASALEGPVNISDGQLQLSIPKGLYIHDQGITQLVGMGYILAPEFRHPGLGFYVLESNWIGRGLGSLVVHGLSRYVLDILGKPVVKARTLEANERCGGALQAAGFYQTGREDPSHTRQFGVNLDQTSIMRTWMLAKPGSYIIPEGKFRNPTPEQVDKTRRAYEARNHLFDIQVLS